MNSEKSLIRKKPWEKRITLSSNVYNPAGYEIPFFMRKLERHIPLFLEDILIFYGPKDLGTWITQVFITKLEVG